MADFGVVLASSPNQVNAGQQVTYQLTVANNGPAASQNVNVGGRVAEWLYVCIGC